MRSAKFQVQRKRLRRSRSGEDRCPRPTAELAADTGRTPLAKPLRPALEILCRGKSDPRSFRTAGRMHKPFVRSYHEPPGN